MIIAVPFQIIDLHGDGFHPLINVMVFGKTFILVLDTGASKTAFDRTKLSEAAKNLSLILSDRLSTGLGTNTMSSSGALISDLVIGELIVPEFEVAVLDLSSINIAYRQLNQPEVLGVLGGDLLMQYEAVIDYGKKLICFCV